MACSFCRRFFYGDPFTLGKFMLGKIHIHGRIATIFGASTSIALCSFYLLLLIYSLLRHSLYP